MDTAGIPGKLQSEFQLAVWSSGMILASGARGNSHNSPVAVETNMSKMYLPRPSCVISEKPRPFSLTLFVSPCFLVRCVFWLSVFWLTSMFNTNLFLPLNYAHACRKIILCLFKKRLLDSQPSSRKQRDIHINCQWTRSQNDSRTHAAAFQVSLGLAHLVATCSQRTYRQLTCLC